MDSNNSHADMRIRTLCEQGVWLAARPRPRSPAWNLPVMLSIAQNLFQLRAQYVGRVMNAVQGQSLRPKADDIVVRRTQLLDLACVQR